MSNETPHSPPPVGPRWLYLHGFASGPLSKKGVALAEHYASRGVELERLDLRVPSFERLRLGAMIRATREAIGGEHDRAVLFGSSLGGLTAARTAEEDPRVAALVLLAPAFRFLERWRRRLGEQGWHEWQEIGWLDVFDHATGRNTRIDFGFALEAASLDERSGGWPDVRVPTLIVHGADDPVVEVELSRRWAAGKRQVRLVEVPDGHELLDSLPRIRAEADTFLASWLGGA
jgi:uncharacterized protein